MPCAYRIIASLLDATNKHLRSSLRAYHISNKSDLRINLKFKYTAYPLDNEWRSATNIAYACCTNATDKTCLDKKSESTFRHQWPFSFYDIKQVKIKVFRTNNTLSIVRPMKYPPLLLLKCSSVCHSYRNHMIKPYYLQDITYPYSHILHFTYMKFTKT